MPKPASSILIGNLAFLFLMILITGACSPAVPGLAIIPDSPEAIDDGWLTGGLSDVGIDPDKIGEMLQAIEDGEFKHLHSILIVKDGKLVFEEYFNGFNRERKAYTASVTKSVTSILIGQAIDQELIPGEEALVAYLLPDYQPLIAADPAKEGLQLWHLLTMTSGLEWDEHSYPYSDMRNDCRKLDRTDDAPRLVLERQLVTEPGETFYYSCANTMLLSAILERATGERADLYAETQLFEPLDISTYLWEFYGDGLAQTDGGLHLRPRDLAKIGTLMLNDGQWEGEQIVSAKWVEASTRARIRAGPIARYGYQWWRANMPFYFQNTKPYFAAGTGGQQILVFPAQEMVVVITSALSPHDENTARNHFLLVDYILPAALPATVNTLILGGWLLLAVIGLVVLFKDMLGRGTAPLAGWFDWLLTLLIFGPAGWLAYALAGRDMRSGHLGWRAALGWSALASAWFSLGILLLTIFQTIFLPDGSVIVLILILPPLLVWLCFQARLLVARSENNVEVGDKPAQTQVSLPYFKAARRTFFQSLALSVLMLAGNMLLIILLSLWWFPFGQRGTSLLDIVMLVLAGLGGTLFAFPFYLWRTRKKRAEVSVLTT